VRAAYNRAQFGVERRALLAAWADYCAGKQPASKVVDLTNIGPRRVVRRK
jgi:hypothetical protein